VHICRLLYILLLHRWLLYRWFLYRWLLLLWLTDRNGETFVGPPSLRRPILWCWCHIYRPVYGYLYMCKNS
jgi:hypothetical protein